MNTLKKAKPKRFVSILLAFVMVLTMMPLTAMPASAAEANPAWQDIRSDRETEPWILLYRYLQNNSIKYLRLQCDIVLDEGENNPFWYGNDSGQQSSNILIVGEKHLDLNGHKIVYRNDSEFPAGMENHTLFKVTEGASFTLYDTGKGGRISYEGPVNRYGGPERNVFWVDNGAKMTINGGEIEAGRSKSVYLGYGSKVFKNTSNSYESNKIGSLPPGSYVRDQSSGCAVIVAAGGEMVMNNGNLAGRAELSVTDNYAAVYMYAGSTVTINDGWLRGNGGASCIIVESPKNKSNTPKANLTIRSGVFDLKTPDNLRFDKANDAYGVPYWSVIHGPYGHMILGLDYSKSSSQPTYHSASDEDFEASVYFNDGIYIEGTSRTKIEKDERLKKPGLDSFSYTNKTWTFCSYPNNEANTRVQFSSVPKTNTWLKNSHATVEMTEYASYYPKEAMDELNKYKIYMAALDRDPNRTTADIFAVAQIFDANGKAVSDEYWSPIEDPSRANQSWDLYNFKTAKGEAISYQVGKSYSLRVTVYEYWHGQHNWTVENCAKYYFIPVDMDIEGPMNFHITAKAYGVSDDGNAAMKVTPSYNTTSASNLNSVLLLFGYTEYKKGSSVQVWEDRIYLKTADNSKEDVVVKGIPAGAQKLVGYMQGTETVSGIHHDIFTYTDVFVMPRILVKQSGGSSYAPTANNYIRTEEGAPVTLQAFDESAIKYSAMHPTKPLQYVVDPDSGRTLAMNDVAWEILDAGNTYQPIGDSYGGIKIEDGRLITDRSGVYRAKILYNGSYWYSPEPITVIGKNYSTAEKKVTITSNVDSMEWNDRAAELTVQFNRNAAGWDSPFAPPTVEIITYEDDVPAGAWEKLTSIGGAISGNTCVLTTKTMGISASEDTFTYKLYQFFNNIVLQKNTVPGTYRFYARVTGSDKKAVLSQTPVTVRIEKRATGMDILVNGQNLTNGKADTYTPTYTMPVNTNAVTVRTQRVMADASLPGGISTTYTSSDPSVATIDEKGNLVAKAPGKTTITVTSRGTIKKGTGNDATTEELRFSGQFMVIIPIAGFKVGDEPDWQAAVTQGKKYEQVEIPVTHVKSYNGEWVANTNNKYLTATCVSADGLRPRELGSSDRIDAGDKVAYNDTMTTIFRVQPQSGYQFPLVYTNSGVQSGYSADMHNIRANFPGGTKEATLALNGYWFDEVKDLYKEGTSGAEITDAAVRFRVEVPCVKDPDAVYLKAVAISTEEPKEGDYRYQGDLDSKNLSSLSYLSIGCNMMNVKVLTLENETASDNPFSSAVGSSVVGVYNSHVNKIADPKGSGNNYGMVDSYEDLKGRNTYECSSIFLGDDTKESILSHRYEPGTYIHNLQLYAGYTNIADGKKYYFDPEVQVFVNSRPVSLDYAGTAAGNVPTVYNGYGAQRLRIYYYYVADESPAFNSAAVAGLVAPMTGETPQEADDLKVINVTRSGSSDYVDYHDLYVSRLEWFIDKNNNGVIDSGESCEGKNDNLSAGGTFLPETVYSVWIELATDSGRIDNQAFTLRLNGVDTPISTESSKASYTFA